MFYISDYRIKKKLDINNDIGYTILYRRVDMNEYYNEIYDEPMENAVLFHCDEYNSFRSIWLFIMFIRGR